jgi:transcription elongation factor Elf1
MFGQPDAVSEHRFRCPYCGEAITFLLDTSAAGESYIEDCEVCCQAIEASFEVDADGAIARFVARRLDD